MIRNFFIDANVIVAIIKNQFPRATHCAKVLSLAQDPRYKVYTSPHTLSICHYFGEKTYGKQRANELVTILTSKLHISNHLASHVDAINNNKQIEDFEDGLQYFSAIDENCKAIITNNTQDFYFSNIPIFMPKDFLCQDAKSRNL
jgi:predicted nucleic acid-binding protein